MSKKVDIGDGFYTMGGSLFDEVTGSGYELATGAAIQFDLNYDGPSRFDESRAAALRAGYDWAAMVQARFDEYDKEHGYTLAEHIAKVTDDCDALLAEFAKAREC